jgi:hypothetical protein
LKNYWISWWARALDGAFELHFPWWVSGEKIDEDSSSICAAVKANSEKEVREMIYICYDTRPEDLEWRFIEERPDDWSPFCDRFPKAEWMEKYW